MTIGKDEELAPVSTVEVVVKSVDVLPPRSLARTRVREARVTLPRLRFLEGDDGN